MYIINILMYFCNDMNNLHNISHLGLVMNIKKMVLKTIYKII